MMASTQLMSFVTLLVVAYCWSVIDTASAASGSVNEEVSFNCPTEMCRCGLDPRGRLKVVCDRGNMEDPIPIRAMDSLTEVLVITASAEKPNTLTIGPIFQSLTKLEELKITNSYVPAIGKHSFWGLRSLRTLDLSSNNISGLVESNFRGLISLEELHLDDNIIDSIPSAAFRHLPALRRLSLTNNRLSEFVPRLFYGLHRLEELDLSENPLKDLEPEVFRDIRLLRTLRCRRCGLTYINPLLLHLLPDIVTLDLGENSFYYIEKNAFSDLQQLRNLFLDGNQVSVLTSGVLTGHNFTKLSLARNKLMTIDPSAFYNVTVNEMDLSYNRLQSLAPSVFIPLNRSLTRIKIGGNPLQASHLWSSVLNPRVQLNLIELDVADMPIGCDPHFQPDLFSFHQGLKYLNLSGTNFSFIPAEMIRTLPSLRELDLSRNQLYSLTDLVLNALSALQNLRRIYLHSNPWYCDACVIGPMLKWLDISPATQHIKDNCRGLKSNSQNMTINYKEDDAGLSCPVCHQPSAVAGVELPRLDHVNLPRCNYPPSLIDSHGLPSKVRVGSDPTATVAAGVPSSMERIKAFLGNPVYLALVCGVGILLMIALCAGIAVLSRHAASYYTNEEKRHKMTSIPNVSASECEGLFPLSTTKIVESREKGTQILVTTADDSSMQRINLNKNNNRSKKIIPMKNTVVVRPASTTVTNRGVYCPGISSPNQTSPDCGEKPTL